MFRSLSSDPLRLGVRVARLALRATRELSELGLAALELAERVLGETPPSSEAAPVESAERPAPVPAPLEPDRELVEEVADPGAEDGAGASVRVAPPFAGYDELRAADVIARLGGADMAELGETELYERTHRTRRTVLDAIAREIKRRPPG